MEELTAAEARFEPRASHMWAQLTSKSELTKRKFAAMMKSLAHSADVAARAWVSEMREMMAPVFEGQIDKGEVMEKVMPVVLERYAGGEPRATEEGFVWLYAKLRAGNTFAVRQMLLGQTGPQHAVCLSGHARSFSEVGHNIREAVLRLLGTPMIAYFGVRPADDPWTMIQKMIPLEQVQVQRICYDEAQLGWATTWLHCDMRRRKGLDCRKSFLQQLCDLEACYSMISAFEARSAHPFRMLVRLRPDIYWEASLALPQVLGARTIYVPGLDSQDGVNDHLAFGAREPMGRYLNRIHHIRLHMGLLANASAAGSDNTILGSLDARALRGHTGEFFLGVAMQLDRVVVKRVAAWATCKHNRQALYLRVGFRGCIGRIRCRAPCASLVCMEKGPRAGLCDCFNETCATIQSGRAVATVPLESPPPSDDAPARVKREFNKFGWSVFSATCIRAACI